MFDEMRSLEKGKLVLEQCACSELYVHASPFPTNKAE
jgi:hypothetical protein